MHAVAVRGASVLLLTDILHERCALLLCTHAFCVHMHIYIIGLVVICSLVLVNVLEFFLFVVFAAHCVLYYFIFFLFNGLIILVTMANCILLNWVASYCGMLFKS